MICLLEMQEKILLLKRELYGGKLVSSDYWKHIQTFMEHLQSKPCYADPVIWMMKAIKPTDGTEYWKFVILYVDNTIWCCHCSKEVLE